MYRLTRGFAIISVLMFLLGAGSRAVEFASPAAYAVGPQPAGVITGDFNGDGKLDLAVFNTGSNTISILLGNGDGTFQAATSVAAGANVGSLALGDFNDDGKPDIALFASSQIVVLLGNGDGTFQSPVVTTLPASTQPLALGDFNGDKKSDAIIGNADSSGNMTLQILLGNGDGTFQNAQPISASGTLTNIVAVADFNKDGKLDLAVGVAGGVKVLVGQGDGTFVDLVSTVPVAAGSVSKLRVADVNADGYPDLIVDTIDTALPGMPKSQQNICVLLNNGSAGFYPEQVFVSNLSFLFSDNSDSTVVFGDFNGDGKLDVVLGKASAPYSARVLLGKGDGTFAPPVIFDEPAPLGVAGSFNGDKFTDLTVLDAANGNVIILLNDSPASGTDLAILASSASGGTLTAGIVGVGTTLTYTAQVLNEGPQDGTGVIFTDTLPNSVSLVSATASKGTCSQSSSVVTCSIGSLFDTSDVQITIVVTTNVAGSLTNNMSITGNEPDGATANNAASQNSSVVPMYTLTVTKSGEGTGTVTVDGAACGGSTCSFSFPSGYGVTISFNADPGSIVESLGACAGHTNDLGNCFLPITSNTSLSVIFGIVPDYTITAASISLITKSGATVSDILTVTPQGGFTGTVNLTCSVTGPAPLPTCGLSLTSIAGGGNSTFTITALPRNSVWFSPRAPVLRKNPLVIPALLAAFAMLIIARRRMPICVPARRGELLLGAALAAILCLCSCGGSGPTLAPQSYTVTVTANWPVVTNSTKTIQIQLTVD